MKECIIALVEVGEYYVGRIVTTRTERCTMEEAQQIAKGAGYQIIEDLCTIVPTTHEVHIVVAVEPEREEVKQ